MYRFLFVINVLSNFLELQLPTTRTVERVNFNNSIYKKDQPKGIKHHRKTQIYRNKREC